MSLSNPKVVLMVFTSCLLCFTEDSGLVQGMCMANRKAMSRSWCSAVSGSLLSFFTEIFVFVTENFEGRTLPISGGASWTTFIQ